MRHYYSVPYQLARQQVDVRMTDSTIEVLFKNRRVASHVRNFKAGGFTTLWEHMPKSHQKHLEWTPSRIIDWAGKNGPKTKRLISHILECKPHPEQGFRSCLGIMKLVKRYSPERLEAACHRALMIKGYSYKSVKSILKNGLDQQPLLFEEKKQIVCPTIPMSGEMNITLERRPAMLNQQTLEKLYAMKLDAMADAFKEQMQQPDMNELAFEERFSLLVDRLWTWKEERRMSRLLKSAKLKINGCG